jgi:hypothetical protein
MRWSTRFLAAGAIVVGIVAAPQATRGSLIITGGGTHQIPDPIFLYSFKAFLDGGTTGSTLAKGDFFTIYDIPFLDPGTNSQLNPDGSVSANWKASFAYLGLAPPGFPSPNDCDHDFDPAHPELYQNVSWQFKGTGIGDGSIVAGIGQKIFLGTFFVSTTSDAPGAVPVLCYGAQTTDPNGNKVGNMGTFLTNPVPEPSSILMLGVGATIGLAGMRRRRLKR